MLEKILADLVKSESELDFFGNPKFWTLIHISRFTPSKKKQVGSKLGLGSGFVSLQFASQVTLFVLAICRIIVGQPASIFFFFLLQTPREVFVKVWRRLGVLSSADVFRMPTLIYSAHCGTSDVIYPVCRVNCIRDKRYGRFGS